MKIANFSTLYKAVNYLNEEEYTEDFRAREKTVLAHYSKNECFGQELRNSKTFLFSGMDGPKSGTKRSLVMSYSFQHC